MKSSLRKQKVYYRYKLRKKFHLLLFILILSITIGSVVYSYRPEVFSTLIEMVSAKIEGIDINSRDSFSLALLIAINNIVAAVVIFLLGFVPFLFLPTAIVVFNGVIIGVFATRFTNYYDSIPLTLASLVPHGIFELLAILYAGAIGLHVCYQMTTILTKNVQTKIKTVIKSAVLSFVTVVIPLLIIAAFIEAYVTPVITHWVL